VSGRYFGWGESSGPIAVEGGVKARSKRGAIGEQWWSRRFIATLEAAGVGGRLARGRSYARRGQVLEFSLSAGKVTARVQGSRPSPYKVSITVPPLTAAQWKKVESRLAAQALFRARLLAGEMPAEIEQVFADAGTPLFPGSDRDLTMHCSCPDWEVPCKHLAAVCYVLAEAFDDDPFAMLAWRGRTREDLLAALRGATAGGPGRRTGRPGRGRQSGPGGAGGHHGQSAGGVGRGLLVARAEPGPAARGATQPRHPARPAASGVRPAPHRGPRPESVRHPHPRLRPAGGRSGGGPWLALASLQCVQRPLPWVPNPRDSQPPG
jgi:hypothetical protein